MNRSTVDSAAFAGLSDEELVARAGGDETSREAALETLYSRYYVRVAAWCLRLSGNRQEAAELAQEVFLRVHTRLPNFRGDSRFSTWLFMVTRSVVINRGVSANRRRAESLDEEGAPELVDPQVAESVRLEDEEVHRELRRAVREDLLPLEGKVLLLHFVHGMTLDRITDQLGLDNKSGAKAYIVAAKRKLQRGFGTWFTAQSTPVATPRAEQRP